MPQLDRLTLEEYCMALGVPPECAKDTKYAEWLEYLDAYKKMMDKWNTFIEIKSTT